MAVFTHLTKDQIKDFLTHYKVGTLTSFEGILQGIDNTNYKIDTTTGKYVLTVFESRINPDDLPFFLGYMQHLSDNGINCPAPVRRTDGQNTSTLSGKKATLFPFLEGRDVNHNDITPALCHEVGILLGKMHLAGQTCPMTRPNSMAIDAWASRIQKVGDRAVAVLGDKTSLPFSEILYLKTNWPDHLPAGAIHADLFPDNVFIKDGHIYGVIDFYFAATDFLAFDLAIVMNAWCFNPTHQFDQAKWASLLSGYESVRPLTQQEKGCFQILCRGAAMRFLSSRLHDLVFHDPNALVTPKPPTEYMQKLEFHQNAKLF